MAEPSVIRPGVREKKPHHACAAVYARRYVEGIKRAMDLLHYDRVEGVAEKLWEGYRRGRKIFILGNGGSAATAAHFACDLSKGTAKGGKKRFKVIALTDNLPLLTAWSNDCGYETVFVEQLKNLLEPEDIVIGISGSGNSKNVLNAIEYAKRASAYTIGISGFDGGGLARLSDECITVETDDMQQIEDVHLMLAHIVSRFLRLKLEGL